ncbi:hypothetical protein Q4555_16115 [Octadecabacter sp. 1_MG-2023]|uniref:hypothetical protein n=1 Tax=unclassified Octadecabacter TaxID=196158 RepID=UPI001C094E5A|nr:MULTISPECIES: hypothetical protein [unclassified Octadecabacter]MBU2992056.1 hypothetical protein [Octadecabacter sp. B2R22]MDO6736201.1 hypothetical protein [Octadecabacter sp. 1_MG-2023]
MTRTTGPILTFALAAGIIAAPFMATAQNQDRPQRGPDIAAMATDLGVTEAALETCMPRPERGERPEPGSQSSTQQERPAGPDAAAIASCLQEAGAGLTQAQVDAVLESHAPERPERG